MIDPNTLETVAAIAGIAALGGAVIFVATRPKVNEEFTDADPGAIKWAPHPVSATISPDPEASRLFEEADAQARALISTGIDGRVRFADGRAPMVLGEEVVVTAPNYIVPKVQAGGSWLVHERYQDTELFMPRHPPYARRSSALRAARRLNAKDAAANALGGAA